METRFNINGREVVREEKEDRVIVSDKCFNCHQKGIVAVRMIFGKKTQNKINLCKNTECFRYAENVPNNWAEC
jgi:hypothetical protein